MSAVDDWGKVARDRPEKLRQLKKEGARVVGYMGRFVPEELVYASGAVPYMMCRGGEPEPPDAVLPFMLRFMSPYTRSQIGSHLLNMDPAMPLFDLIVLQSLDCHEARIADLFEYLKLPTFRLGVPADWQKEMSAEYYYESLGRFREKLEELTGKKITDAGLRASIESLNEIRRLLRKISLLRKKPRPPIGGYDFIRANHFSFYTDPEETSRRLKDLQARLERDGSPFAEGAPRILMMGHVVAVGDYVVPKLVEDSGGVVVCELLDEGMRHCDWEVKADGDPMKGLGESYYLGRTPPSAFQPAWADRIEYVKGLFKDFGVDGVIWYQLFMEEDYDLEGAVVQKTMGDLGMPCLRLESSYEYSREAMGPLTTRIESFVHSIATRRR